MIRYPGMSKTENVIGICERGAGTAFRGSGGQTPYGHDYLTRVLDVGQASAYSAQA
ncbi:hypothetical protein [Actibacterium lipolyticum]|uniref:hypothetical protein n=1 Tax=Actibacterium lipolyticum TaxID=1524263 RepID=UPI001595B4C1|nr:hypothetical protein [Actibacterium lipolyticum]